MRNNTGTKFISVYDFDIEKARKEVKIIEFNASFETGVLDKEETLRRLNIEKLFNQILFHTEKSLEFCRFHYFEDLGGKING